jgi:hypothetical protein
LSIHFIREGLQSAETERDENGQEWRIDFAREIVVYARALFVGE